VELVDLEYYRGCQCPTSHPPCSFCTGMDEEESEAYASGGYNGLYLFIEERNRIEDESERRRYMDASKNVEDLSGILKGLGSKPKPAVASLVKEMKDSGSADGLYYPPGVKDQITAAINARKHFLLVGPPGCGKSTLARGVMDAMDIPYSRLQYHRDMDAQDHIGSVALTQENGASVTDIVWAPNIHAMEKGTAIVGDEVDSLNPATSFPLFAQWDDSDIITVQCNGVSRVVHKHPGFFCALTANTNGTGDDSGDFGGTDIMNQALRDRIEFIINIDYLPAKEEIKLLKGKVPIDKGILKNMCKVAESTRKDTSPVAALSTRRLIAWARAYESFIAMGKTSKVALKLGVRDGYLESGT